MPPKSVPPSVSEVAFDCPHCGAYTTHTWYDAYAERRRGDERAPGVVTHKVLDYVKTEKDFDDETRARFLAHFEKVLRGLVTVDRRPSSKYVDCDVGNVHYSVCFNCGDVAVWVHDHIVFPPVVAGPAANPDLPTGVMDDYNEASRIVNVSPRGAAALLRLSIQKLCVELGERGKKIDDDIASLVKKGLSPLVQKALDAVRVIGNEAVHPGTLDLKDDTDTASKLFGLVNLIAEQMISNPKHVAELYGKLPPAKLKAIEERDGKA